MAGEQDRWIEDEPRLGRAGPQVLRRALRRPFRTLGLALVLTAGFVTSRVHRAPAYEATLYLRLGEGDVSDPNNAPRPPRVIREYIANVALSQHELTRIMGKLGIYRKVMATDPMLAVSLMREDIAISVTRNYFIYEREGQDEPRSAQIAIGYKVGDPEMALSVVRELGAAVLREQTARRRVHFELARTVADAALRHQRGEIKSAQAEMDRLSVDLAGADANRATAMRAQIAAMHERMKMDLAQLQQLEKRSADIEFASDAEKNKLGLNFEVIDEGVVSSTPPRTTMQVARLTLSTFVAVLVVTAMMLGGLDRGIYSPSDLESQGIPVLGAMPRFSGDNVGSFRDRSKRRGWGRS
jgi:hypothetical protein